MIKILSRFSKSEIKKSNIFDEIVKKSVVTIVFLIPVFFLTFLNIPLLWGKGSVLYIAIIVIFILWIIARLKDGEIIIPKSLLLITMGVLPVVFLLSSIFSDSIRQSLVGSGYETGTFAAIFLLSILAFLVSTSFDTMKKTFSLYTALFYTGIIAFIYLIVSYIFNSTVFFQMLPLSIIGSLNDTALYFGFLVVISLITIELIVLSKKIRILIYTALTMSLFGMFLINFTTGWIIVGLFSLLTFVYALSFGGKKITSSQRTIPVISLVVMLVSLLFVLGSEPIGNMVTSNLNIQSTEIHPSWIGTADVARSTIFGEGVSEMLLGGGPNRFENKWVLHRTEGVNATIAWNVDFTSGVGTLPTFVVTTGLLGLIALLAFLGVFIARGTQMVILSSISSDKITRYALASTFFGGLYLWAVAVFYISNIVIFSLAFIFTGLFISALMHAEIIKKYKINILQDPRISFISVLILIGALMLAVSGAYALLQRFGSMLYYQSAVASINDVTIDITQRNIDRAIGLTNQDYYHRDLSQIHIAQLGEILNKDVSEESRNALFLERSRLGIDSALTAVDIDESNYLNWVTLAQAYQVLIQFGLQEGYDNARLSYEKALELNPNSPIIRLDQARLELTQNNVPKAKEYIRRAISLKSNYTAAIFLLSQIQMQEGEIEQAIESVMIASLIAPNDTGVYFQLGFLKYQNEDYVGAISAFERSIELNPLYANAMYFLGLSYDELGQNDLAIDKFEQILELNPGNEEVLSIIANLRAGRSALESNRTPPPRRTVQPPEKRDEPPFKEAVQE